MKKLREITATLLLSLSIFVAKPSRADLFGGDVVVLTQILAQAIQQLIQLKEILSTGSDTLDLLRDVNRGIAEGLAVIQIINPRFNPGLYGNLHTAESVLAVIENLYGKIPKTAETRLQEAHDLSASESIAMTGPLYRYADEVDLEGARIAQHARLVNPQGAGKLTAQAISVLIGVTNQVLRTNSQMLKLMGENLALTNRKEKLQSSQFKAQYDGISSAIKSLPKIDTLPSLNAQ